MIPKMILGIKKEKTIDNIVSDIVLLAGSFIMFLVFLLIMMPYIE
jgi:hypothetical protein